MALPPWAVDAIRRGIVDVARKAGDQETLSKLKQQATEIFRDLPDTAARSVEAIVRTAKTGTQTLQRWADRQPEIAVPLINASGRLLDNKLGSGCPIPDAVLQVGCDLLRGDCKRGGLRERIDHRLDQLVSGHGIAVAGNLDLAIEMVSQLSPEWGLAIHRSQAIRLPSGTPLPDAFGASAIREVGGVQRIEPDDFNGLSQTIVVLADAGEVEFTLPTSMSDTVRFAVVLPVGTLTDEQDGVPSAAGLLAGGVDLVILSGDGLAGGPSCGLLVGRTDWIERLTSHPQWRGHAASDAVAAMMLSALEHRAVDVTPESDVSTVRQLIAVNEDNLRSRAERMSTRLSGADSIHSCQITDHPAWLIESGRWQFPSRQLRVRHTSRSATQWASDLAQGDPAISVGVDGDEIVVDLRWVPASADGSLAERLES
ncbi:hypothetical protein [Stieleria varia]|uniref:L-seryl-tRNA(Sec) selenium transferase n=1 Tax=Stieleria varia TaxID=2528005 RepID=A0A5C6AYG4_9BACT|nr:hypothetical protein [Stieleria varia]TWU04527.1 L-seryl-tRNA(Sec) selenium transferase [Stieleria varia]